MDQAEVVKGFQWAGVHAGLKGDNALDLALIVSDTPCAVAGVFTTNHVKAAPVLYAQSIVKGGNPVRAIIANSGNANAATGAQGLQDTHTLAGRVAEAIGCQPEEVLVLSTGVIGVPLPMDVLLPGVDAAAAALHPAVIPEAAQAIMTTDTRPKIASVRAAAGFTVTGIAKGAGMIAPDMATMLAVIVTDFALPSSVLRNKLHAAANKSFNRIVVDGDMSTNDTVLLLANGASGVPLNEGGAQFDAALEAVCTSLAQAIVRDGEGATKFVTLNITGAAHEKHAEAVARAIATSPLCKTAFFGADPNWGRIIAAAGRAGVTIEPERLALWLLGAEGGQAIQLVEDGAPTTYDEAAAIDLMTGDAFGFRLDLGRGEATTTVWTCDLSHDYVTINGHYRT